MQFKYWDYYFTMFPPDPAGEFCRYQNQPCRGKTVFDHPSAGAQILTNMGQFRLIGTKLA